MQFEGNAFTIQVEKLSLKAQTKHSNRENLFFPGEKTGVLATIQSFWGRLPTNDLLRRLIGAHNDSCLYLGLLGKGFYVEHYEQKELGLTGFCEIRRTPSGSLQLWQELQILRRNRQRQGMGRKIFQAQINACQELGISQIFMWGRRTTLQSGYYVLPRFGFQGALPIDIRPLLPPIFRPSQNIEEVFQQEKGAKWWSKYGISFPAPLVFTIPDRKKQP